MKIVVDAMSAEFGGIRTYVEHVLTAWSAEFADDELHVVVPPTSTLPTGQHHRHVVAVRRPAMLGRPWAQTRHLRRIAREVDADVVWATAPATTVASPRRPLLLVIYDLRHELMPEQFDLRTRILRRLSYTRAYRLAAGFVSISQRSLDDLHSQHPELRAKPAWVTHLGADHTDSWEPAAESGPAITFAHHSNKNPELILDGWRELHERGAAPRLLILGVGQNRATLAAEVQARGLSELVTLAPFLPEQGFQKAMAEASVIVFPSTFEGFGLPVVEGMLLGVPVVIGPERATVEIAGGHAFAMAEFTPGELADAVGRALEQTPQARDAARAHAAEFSWRRTARQTRAALETLADAGSR